MGYRLMRNATLFAATAGLIAAGVAGGMAGSAGAAGEDRFTCRASAVRGTSPLINSEPIIANGQLIGLGGDPCADDFDEAFQVKVPSAPPPSTAPPLLTADVLMAHTDDSPSQATSQATATQVVIKLGTHTIRARILHAEATATCQPDGTVKLHGWSKIVSVSDFDSATGKTQTFQVGTQPNQTFAIPGLGFITFNEQKTEDVDNGKKLTVRALHLGSGALQSDLVVSEAIADYHGNPCGTQPDN